MSYFKAKMHQIRFRSLQRSPRPLAGFKGPTSKGRGGKRWGGEGRGGEWKGRGREGKEGRGEEGEEWEGDSFGPRSGPLLFCGSTPMLDSIATAIKYFLL